MSLFERIDSIYVSVTDLQASTEWYQDRLGLELHKQEKGCAQFKVYGGETKLTLVEMVSFRPIHYVDEGHKAPYFNLHTLDFEKTYERLHAVGVPLSAENNNEFVRCFELMDPDDNWLGGCFEKLNSPFFKPTNAEFTLFDRIGAVFMPVRDLQKSLDWYVRGLGLTLYNHWGKGADLGVNSTDNLITLLVVDGMDTEKLEHVGRSYFSFFSADLELSRSLLEKEGVFATNTVTEQESAYFRLTDPDGHGLLVISGVTNGVVI
jgi:catechol 2,3-dioxygenase-like lactoylglutathione lyase family enzyme